MLNMLNWICLLTDKSNLCEPFSWTICHAGTDAWRVISTPKIGPPCKQIYFKGLNRAMTSVLRKECKMWDRRDACHMYMSGSFGSFQWNRHNGISCSSLNATYDILTLSHSNVLPDLSVWGVINDHSSLNDSLWSNLFNVQNTRTGST